MAYNGNTASQTVANGPAMSAAAWVAALDEGFSSDSSDEDGTCVIILAENMRNFYLFLFFGLQRRCPSSDGTALTETPN